MQVDIINFVSLYTRCMTLVPSVHIIIVIVCRLLSFQSYSIPQCIITYNAMYIYMYALKHHAGMILSIIMKTFGMMNRNVAVEL